MHLKALAGDFALDSVCGFKDLFFFLSLNSGDKEKLTGGRHFYLNGVKKFDVLFDELPDLCIFLNFKAFGQIGFVIVKAFRGVGADDLNVGQRRQHHHQMAYLDFDIGVGQHRDIGGRYKVEEQLALIG